MLDRKLNTRMNKYFRNNSKSIVECLENGDVFDYNEDFLRDLYAFIYNIVNDLEIPKQYHDDYASECMLLFTSKNWATPALKSGKHSFSVTMGVMFNRYIENLQKKTGKMSEMDREASYLKLLGDETLIPSEVYFGDVDEYTNILSREIDSDEILKAYFVENKKIKEIAQQMNIKENKVRERLSKKIHYIRCRELHYKNKKEFNEWYNNGER